MKYGKRLFYYVVFSSVVLTLSPRNAFAADVVINEFVIEPTSSQWVELYNKNDSAIDISGWIIDDNGGTEKFTVPANTMLPGKAYKVFESSQFNFNKSSEDSVRLFNNTSLEDSYSYESSPGTGYSYGRQYDGDISWGVFSLPTKEASNNTATPIPTSTPTPLPTVVLTSTPSPTPTKVPTPTKAPTPTKSPTSTPVPTVTKTPTPAPIKTPTPTSSRATVMIADKNVLAASKEAEEDTPTPILLVSKAENKKPSASPAVIKGVSTTMLPAILVVFGLVLVGSCGILLFLRYRKTIYEKDGDYT